MTCIPQLRSRSGCASRARRAVAASVALGLWCGPFSSAAIAQNSTGVTTSVTGEVTPDRSSRKKSKDDHAARSAEDAFIAGARALERNDRTTAEREFNRAAELAPDNRDYALALNAVRDSRVTDLVHSAGKARLMGKDSEAESLLAQARAIDPNNAMLLQHPDPRSLTQPQKEHSWIVDGPRLATAIQLTPKDGLHSFHFRGTIPEAVKQVAAAYDIKTSIDGSVDNRQLKFDLEDVTYAQAMHVLMGMGPLFAVPLSPASILVLKDNEENRNKYERQIQETIYAGGSNKDALTDLSNMIKNVFGVKQISIEDSFGTVVVRAPEETLRVLNLTLADMLDGGSEVMIDVKMYSVDQTRTTNVGATGPTQAGAYSVASAANALVAANQTLVNQAIAQGVIPAGSSNVAIAIALVESGLVTSSLLSSTLAIIGGGLSTAGVYSNSSANLNFALNSSDTRAIDEIQLRVGDRQSATFRAGSKYPITQSTYSTTIPTATTSALAGATVNGVSVASLLASATTATVPQVQYEDLGVTLKATPFIQKSGQVSLHLDLKIESLAGGTVDNIPILNNSQFTSDVTVPDGGTAFLVSNMTKSQSAAVTGIPGLSELPGFQSSPELEKTTDAGQLLMVLTPHVVRRRTNEAVGPVFPISIPAATSE